MNNTIPAAPTMRAILRVILGVLIVLCSVEVQGQTPSFVVQQMSQVYSWGSSNAVYQYAATNSQYVTVIVSGKTNANSDVGVDLAIEDTGPYIFTDGSQVSLFFQELLLADAQYALTNTTVTYIKSLPLKVVAYTWGYDFDSGEDYFYLDVLTNFNLVYTNGVYSLPDLSGIHLAPYALMPIRVPDMTWGRVEISYSTNTANPFCISDSRYGTPVPEYSYAQGVDIADQVIYVNTPYLESGTNGPYQVKVSWTSSDTTNVFRVFNGSGYQIRTPLMLSLGLGNGLIGLQVLGGDAGETFVVQSKTNFSNLWIQADSRQFTVGTNGLPMAIQEPAIIPHFLSGPPTGNGFFRLVTTNVVPQ